MSISAEYDQHYMDNFNAIIEQEKQREQARRRKKEDLYSFFELHYVPEGDFISDATFLLRKERFILFIITRLG